MTEETEVDVLARRMWHRYIQAQPKDERGHYRRWRDQQDAATIQGFRALARVTLSGGWRKK